MKLLFRHLHEYTGATLEIVLRAIRIIINVQGPALIVETFIMRKICSWRLERRAVVLRINVENITQDADIVWAPLLIPKAVEQDFTWSECWRKSDEVKRPILLHGMGY